MQLLHVGATGFMPLPFSGLSWETAVTDAFATATNKAITLVQQCVPAHMAGPLGCGSMRAEKHQPLLTIL